MDRCIVFVLLEVFFLHFPLNSLGISSYPVLTTKILSQHHSITDTSNGQLISCTFSVLLAVERAWNPTFIRRTPAWKEKARACHVIGYPRFVMQRSVIRAICLAQSLPTLNTFTRAPKPQPTKTYPEAVCRWKEKAWIKEALPRDACWMVLGSQPRHRSHYSPKSQPSWQIFKRTKAHWPRYVHSSSASVILSLHSHHHIL